METVKRRVQKRWLRDYEVEDETDGALSASFLRKDRLGRQLIPFHRIGKSVFYDLDEVNAAIEKSRFGGRAA